MMRLRDALPWVLAAGFAGCGGPAGPELQTEYGSRQAVQGGNASVNGVGVLAEMFQSAGHSVLSSRKLNPRLEKADVIIWFINDGKPPSQAAGSWLENWLYQSPGRTLVVVPPDFSAEPLYWRKVQSQAAAGQQAEVQQRIDEADLAFAGMRRQFPPGVSDWRWFNFDSTDRPRQVNTLSGDPSWTQGVNPANLEIELRGRIIPKHAYDREVLTSDPDHLVIEHDVGQSRVLVVANGSFLLNVPLVNKEHRKLAGALINDVGGHGETVVFLEAGGSVPVADKDEAEGIPSTWNLLNVSPINHLLRAMALFSVVLIFALWPIFGLPREDSQRHLTDFGRHLEALGKLLARRGDVRYAWGRLAAYRQITDASGGPAGNRTAAGPSADSSVGPSSMPSTGAAPPAHGLPPQATSQAPGDVSPRESGRL